MLETQGSHIHTNQNKQWNCIGNIPSWLNTTINNLDLCTKQTQRESHNRKVEDAIMWLFIGRSTKQHNGNLKESKSLQFQAFRFLTVTPLTALTLSSIFQLTPENKMYDVIMKTEATKYKMFQNSHPKSE